ncbi:glycosyltransferase family 4 protein [Pedobacter sp. KLB.chiD]|uniref:glycosyltransferase family 4 protein n=1 Tax=Pedobacter sp. KLB.chiD TaxID=3387402 RepID=UPI0039996D63
MKVLFILPEYYPHSGGGISTYYIHYVKKIAAQCEEVKVVIGSGYFQGSSGFEDNNIKTEDLKPYLFSKYLQQFSHLRLTPDYQRNLAAAWAMWEQSNAGEGYDIIECTDFALGYVPWTIHHSKPIITRLHGSYGQIERHEPQLNDKFNGDINRKTELLLLNRCDQLVTHSEQNCKFWQNIFPNKQITVVLPIYKEPSKPRQVTKENFGIVCARIQRWKGPEQLCEAVESLSDPSILIKWYGRDTAYSSELSTSAYLKKKYPTVWEKTIAPQNALPNQEIKVEQAKAKFAVIPSTWDMFNFTLLEYLSVGTPVVCADGAGSSSLIKHGVNGFKYKATNPKELANCLALISNLDQQAYQNMINEGFKTMRTTLYEDALAEQNFSLYRQTLKTFKALPSNIYLDQLFKPVYNKNTTSEILRTFPLKVIFKHVLQRIKQKISR